MLQGSVRSVAFFMLDKVPAPELIAATVERSILSYAEEHEIPLDELLLQYIEVKILLRWSRLEPVNFSNMWEQCFSPSIWSIIGSAGALQFPDHNTLHRMGGQSHSCAGLHDWHWCRLLWRMMKKGIKMHYWQALKLKLNMKSVKTAIVVFDNSLWSMRC